MRFRVGLEFAPRRMQGGQEHGGTERIVGGAHQVAPEQEAQAHTQGGQLLGVLQVEWTADGAERHLLVDLFEGDEAQCDRAGLLGRAARDQQIDFGLQRRLDRGGGQMDEGVVVVLEEIAGPDTPHDGARVGAGGCQVEEDGDDAPRHVRQFRTGLAAGDVDQLGERRLLGGSGFARGVGLGGWDGHDDSAK